MAVLRPATLLASVHDVSPLTLEACQQAVALLRDAAGLRPADLTLLAIPFHEARVRLDAHPPTVRWLREMADAGSTLVLHGLTHRMPRRTVNPTRWLTGYGFARGQGELYCVPAAETAQRLDEGRAIVRQAGLDAAASCFVPPAWLLSRAGRAAVAAAGFEWIELYDGLHTARGTRPLRLIGWGSLNPIEAVATTAFAFLQRQRPSADTRLCVHPADMHRGHVRRSIATTVRRLRRDLVPSSYARYLRDHPVEDGARA
jgi:predicted deacetylase